MSLFRRTKIVCGCSGSRDTRGANKPFSPTNASKMGLRQPTDLFPGRKQCAAWQTFFIYLFHPRLDGIEMLVPYGAQKTDHVLWHPPKRSCPAFIQFQKNF